MLERAGVVRRLLVQPESLVPGIGQYALGLTQGDSAVAQLSTVMYICLMLCACVGGGCEETKSEAG
jgi:hypothetical protein